MIELYRAFRTNLYAVSSYQVFGFQVDTLLHLIVGFLITLFFYRVFKNTRKCVYTVLGLIAFKEIFDLFAKRSIEYIRPPALDAFYDVVFGILGMVAALWLIKRPGRRKSGLKPSSK